LPGQYLLCTHLYPVTFYFFPWSACSWYSIVGVATRPLDWWSGVQCLAGTRSFSL